MTVLSRDKLTVVLDWAVANVYEEFICDLLDDETKKEDFSSRYEVIGDRLNLQIDYAGRKLPTLEFTYLIVDNNEEITAQLNYLDGSQAFKGNITY
jgi:hypothetical protein